MQIFGKINKSLNSNLLFWANGEKNYASVPYKAYSLNLEDGADSTRFDSICGHYFRGMYRCMYRGRWIYIFVLYFIIIRAGRGGNIEYISYRNHDCQFYWNIEILSRIISFFICYCIQRVCCGSQFISWSHHAPFGVILFSWQLKDRKKKALFLIYQISIYYQCTNLKNTLRTALAAP